MSKSRPEIVVDLTARLGNQLFQYAGAKQLELDGAAVVFSNRATDTLGRVSDGPQRLERFVGAPLPFASAIQEVTTGYLPPMNVRWPRLKIVLGAPIVFPTVHRIYRPEPFEARPASLPSRSRYRVSGFFQHRSWFEKSLPMVLAEIEQSIHDARAQYPTFDLCVNFRRGDYVRLGWALSFAYYERSLELLSRSAVHSVVVASNDRLVERLFSEFLQSKGFDACAASTIQTKSPDTNSDESLDPVMRDFCLLVNARNLVMSNSTFCWWAAVLGDAVALPGSQRVVAYPLGWIEQYPGIDDGLRQSTWTPVSGS